MYKLVLFPTWHRVLNCDQLRDASSLVDRSINTSQWNQQKQPKFHTRTKAEPRVMTLQVRKRQWRFRKQSTKDIEKNLSPICQKKCMSFFIVIKRKCLQIRKRFAKSYIIYTCWNLNEQSPASIFRFGGLLVPIKENDS